jgi:hypothetical protein
VLLRAESKGVHIDTLIRGASVALVRLDPREVGTFTLREAILTIELELGNNNGVLAPTVHIEGSLGKHKGAGIGHRGTRVRISSMSITTACCCGTGHIVRLSVVIDQRLAASNLPRE